ncbi:hypothetical protein CDAR_300881 [Caerostris darwini]|uniref:Uncharacterized protein n=1 Tax=Caerostris darwini TaxID=1538125 RepID=A0AAV4WD33_9ARAC|nr:hypothetical protein CDAR_300881 [Caerostris darwini]
MLLPFKHGTNKVRKEKHHSVQLQSNIRNRCAYSLSDDSVEQFYNLLRNSFATASSIINCNHSSNQVNQLI